MGTRGCIAKPDGDGWRGRYHHWDSYPTGLGLTLLEIHETTFHGDTDAMVRYLIDDEPVGWSTINGADWAQPKCWSDGSNDPDNPCQLCTLPMWRHYAQYYPEGTSADPMVNGKRRAGLIHPDEIAQLGHSHEPTIVPTGPLSYSARGETGEQWITSADEDVSGAEWCYVITPRGLLVIEGDYGAFGSGGGNWHGAVMVPWGDTDAMREIESR